jgi:hypothetical protein
MCGTGVSRYPTWNMVRACRGALSREVRGMTSYVYLNEDGSHNRLVKRTADKRFSQFSPSDNGSKWKPGLNGQPTVLYHLPEVLDAVADGSPVWVCEGEKDADSARAQGVVATTNPGGAGKWRDQLSEYLRSATVFLVWDKDDPGRHHALQVAESLERADAEVRFRCAAKGKDLSDHLAAGYSLDELLKQRPRDPATQREASFRVELVPRSFRRVLEALEDYAADNGLAMPKRLDDGSYQACCPAHDDHNPSLNLTLGEKRAVLLHCFAGCSYQAILDALGIEPVRVIESPKTGFSERVSSRRVDLVGLIEQGIPPREYHARSDGMLAVGARHSISAPKKTGKSLAILSHGIRMGLAGERVMVLDRENGADEYARRLDEIMAAWELTPAQRDTIRTNLIYHAFPVLRPMDTSDFVAYCLDSDVDIVVFDSQRRFLTDFGLKESDADDYAKFMEYAIDPLFRASVTTVILDNTPHENSTRARGSVTKGDLVDVVFHIETIEKFDRDTRGLIKLVQDDSRFGDRCVWRMEIGKGMFGKWVQDADAKITVRDDVYRAVSACASLIDAKGQAPTTRALRDALPVSGNRVDRVIQEAEKRGYIEREKDGRALRCFVTDAGYQLIRQIRKEAEPA